GGTETPKSINPQEAVNVRSSTNQARQRIPLGGAVGLRYHWLWIWRNRHGRRAEAAGRDRFRDFGEGPGRGRLLAAEHLSGRGLRRALAPLFVFVRAQSRLVACLRQAEGDPRLP